MPLSVGTRLGPYEIVALVGTGGMGEVYRARDTRLNRDVAICRHLGVCKLKCSRCSHYEIAVIRPLSLIVL